MKKASEKQAAQNARECAGALRDGADKGERARAQGRWQETREMMESGARIRRAAWESRGDRDIKAWKRRARLEWIERKREDLQQAFVCLHYADELLDQFMTAKSWDDVDWVKQEVENAMMDAIRAITTAHQRL